ncbi:uncharacterized protein [Notamacropus eugenii]|uniref:uncharacterized protein n=1 Tax=Notamacropus eugenii TaxID=9315 RepID=UPI003B66B11E
MSQWHGARAGEGVGIGCGLGGGGGGGSRCFLAGAPEAPPPQRASSRGAAPEQPRQQVLGFRGVWLAGERQGGGREAGRGRAGSQPQTAFGNFPQSVAGDKSWAGRERDQRADPSPVRPSPAPKAPPWRARGWREQRPRGLREVLVWARCSALPCLPLPSSPRAGGRDRRGPEPRPASAPRPPPARTRSGSDGTERERASPQPLGQHSEAGGPVPAPAPTRRASGLGSGVGRWKAPRSGGEGAAVYKRQLRL